jgi:hypothetical protein
MKASNVPRRGEVVWPDFDPQAAHEQAKRRPSRPTTLTASHPAAPLRLCNQLSAISYSIFPLPVARRGAAAPCVTHEPASCSFRG